MIIKDIENVAYLLKRAKDKNQPKPIVFLGAGASISSGIPGSRQIIEDILRDFKDKPEIKNLAPEEITYYNLMACLNTEERHELLRGYITNENVKINVSHIYLAQMLKEGWVDYVLTVNFDDLFLRACALFNFIPPVYDLSILKDFTTTTLAEKSVTYLHGQHHGFWLLNTNDELEKVKEYIPTVFDRICNRRTWIVVGYSGEDPIFQQIARLGNFTNDLFWVGYQDNQPNKSVQEKLLDKPNSNAYLISGYDADSFFLKLHSELGLETPDIFNKPFSFLKGLMGNIRDVEGVYTKDEHQKLFEKVKERYDLARKQTDAAIKQYEQSDPTGALTREDITKDSFKQEIIEALVKNNYTIAESLNERAINISDEEIQKLISELYYNWGQTLANKARKQDGIDLYEEAIEKYRIATEIYPKNSLAFNGWGITITDIAEKQANINLYNDAIEKYKSAININSNFSAAYNNYGTAFIALAKEQNSNELFEKAFEMYKKATETNPKNSRAFYNWANGLTDLAEKSKQENLYIDAIEKYKIATEINPKYSQSFYNCGIALSNLAELKDDLNLHKEAAENYRKAIELDPADGSAYSNLSNTLVSIAKLLPESSKSYLTKAIENAQIAYNISTSPYNLSCCYALFGNKEQALRYLEESIVKNDISLDHILNDDDWKDFKNDDDFKSLIQKYSKKD